PRSQTPVWERFFRNSVSAPHRAVGRETEFRKRAFPNRSLGTRGHERTRKPAHAPAVHRGPYSFLGSSFFTLYRYRFSSRLLPLSSMPSSSTDCSAFQFGNGKSWATMRAPDLSVVLTIGSSFSMNSGSMYRQMTVALSRSLTRRALP